MLHDEEWWIAYETVIYAADCVSQNYKEGETKRKGKKYFRDNKKVPMLNHDSVFMLLR